MKSILLFLSLTISLGLLAQSGIGVNVSNPLNTFDVNGNAVIGSGYGGIETAPTDGMLIEGMTGIGETNPDQKLHVKGGIKADSLQLGDAEIIHKIQSGVHNAGASGGAQLLTQAVTFPVAFDDVPTVICTASAQQGSTFDDSFNVTTREITTTGFVIVVNRVDGSSWGQNMDVHWIAIN